MKTPTDVQHPLARPHVTTWIGRAPWENEHLKRTSAICGAEFVYTLCVGDEGLLDIFTGRQ